MLTVRPGVTAEHGKVQDLVFHLENGHIFSVHDGEARGPVRVVRHSSTEYHIRFAVSMYNDMDIIIYKYIA